MKQLIEILIDRPIIIAVLLFWPIFLWGANYISQKILFKYQDK
jgi:hypothetical protein